MIIIGWSAVIIHILTSFAVSRMINSDYEYTVDELSQEMSQKVRYIMVKTTIKKEQLQVPVLHLHSLFCHNIM